MSTRIQTEDKKSQEGNGQNRQGKEAMQGGKTLHTLLERGLKDIYSAEMQIVEALPEMIKAVDNDELEDAFNVHLEQTKKQVSRLEKAFERMGIDRASGEKCIAMEGLIQESKKIVTEFPHGAVRDSALIIGSQKIEHYEIAAYGSLCELADVLGDDRLNDLLGKSLDEEEQTDEILSGIAKDVNDEAAESIEDKAEHEYR